MSDEEDAYRYSSGEDYSNEEEVEDVSYQTAANVVVFFVQLSPALPPRAQPLRVPQGFSPIFGNFLREHERLLTKVLMVFIDGYYCMS